MKIDAPPKITLIDCTLRDGGYYNAWDFQSTLIQEYLVAMDGIGVDVVEMGFRTLSNNGFQGPCAFTTDQFLEGLEIPAGLTVGVMVNANELVSATEVGEALIRIFPKSASDSPVKLVRIACHTHEFTDALPAVTWLKHRGYRVGFNLMQIADRQDDEIKNLAKAASGYPIDTLYFADSMGSMSPDQTARIIGLIREGWKGEIGIHTHDNLGMALSNTLRAMDEGVTWVDSTVTGMGRGPGNAKTEQLAIEVAERRNAQINLPPLLTLLKNHFNPMQARYGWGTNPYYYLAGKHGIHPTYIQEMLNDPRYDEEDVLAVIDSLRTSGGKRFNLKALDAARSAYKAEPTGKWGPQEMFAGRPVLILGSGPGVARHQIAVERFIANHQPVVLALNTLSSICPSMIHFRVACHPVRLMADANIHARSAQPLIAPHSMLPEALRNVLESKPIFDFGLGIEENTFAFGDTHCILPVPLVVGYALAVACSGRATEIFVAGFDGYGSDDPRDLEMNLLLNLYSEIKNSLPITSITPTRLRVPLKSVYGL